MCRPLASCCPTPFPPVSSLKLDTVQLLTFCLASTYFHLPVDEQEDKDIENYQRRFITWNADATGLSTPLDSHPTLPSSEPSYDPRRYQVLRDILDNDDLYAVLGIAKATHLDKSALRRSYLSRSRACHPEYVFPSPFLSLRLTANSKFPADEADATLAFQKVAVAYDILSKPSSRRLYDSRSPSSSYDVFSSHPAGHAEETFRSVIIGAFNDFLDGDLEVIRSLLSVYLS